MSDQRKVCVDVPKDLSSNCDVSVLDVSTSKSGIDEQFSNGFDRSDSSTSANQETKSALSTDDLVNISVCIVDQEPSIRINDSTDTNNDGNSEIKPQLMVREDSISSNDTVASEGCDTIQTRQCPPKCSDIEDNVDGQNTNQNVQYVSQSLVENMNGINYHNANDSTQKDSENVRDMLLESNEILKNVKNDGILDTSVQNENLTYQGVQNGETRSTAHQSGEYRHVIISDTDTSDSDSDSSTSESEVDDVVEVKVEPEDTVSEKIPSDHSDEEMTDSKRKTKHTRLVPRTKGELLPEELPPLEELQITVNPNVELVHIGSVSSIVGVLVIVQSNQNIPPLDDDTILFLEGRVVLGQIFEVFGPVGQPWYSVRFNSVDDICKRKITVGLKVYCAPRVEEYTKYVFVEHLKMMRGSDASWEDNNEPPSQYLDYSDDEQERKAKSKNRRKKKGEEEHDVLPGARVPKQRKHRERNGQSWNQNAGQANEGHHQKTHHWKGKYQSQNINTNDQKGSYYSNQYQGDGYRNNQYQTFQPFGPSPQFRQRMPMNRPPPRHQGPIHPPYFQPPNRQCMQRPMPNRGNFSNGGYQYRNQIQNQNNSYSFNRNDLSMGVNYAAPWNSQYQFGEHDFPAPPPRIPPGGTPYCVPPPSPTPPFGRLMDNRLVQNTNNSEDSTS